MSVDVWQSNTGWGLKATLSYLGSTFHIHEDVKEEEGVLLMVSGPAILCCDEFLKTIFSKYWSRELTFEPD